MLIADSIPAEFWGLLAAVVTLASTAVVALVRQLDKTAAALESLTAKMINDAVPALERSTAAGQAIGPILQQNTEEIGKMIRAAEALNTATQEVLQWAAVLKDRESRPPSRRGT